MLRRLAIYMDPEWENFFLRNPFTARKTYQLRLRMLQRLQFQLPVLPPASYYYIINVTAAQERKQQGAGADTKM